jgi:hypothetical protein
MISGENLSAIYAWVNTENKRTGLSVNSLFQSDSKASDSISGLWWRATPSAETLVALQNTSGKDVKIDTVMTVAGQAVVARPIQLPPYGATLVSVADLVRKRDRALLHREQSGTLRFVNPEGEASMIGMLVQVDPARRFSLPLHMQNLRERKSTMLQTAGFPVGKRPLHDRSRKTGNFHPKVLLANYSDQDMTILVRVLEENPVSAEVMAAADTPVPESELNLGRSFDLAPVVLSPSATRVLDLLQVLDNEGINLVGSIAAAELSHSGLPGELFAEVVSLSDNLSYVFHDPVIDEAKVPTFLTSVSFDLSDDRNKVLTMRNLGEDPVLANYVLYFETSGGVERYHAVRFMPAHSLTLLDLRSIRDNQEPDLYGSVLPVDLTFGHVAVSSEEAKVIAGDFAFDSEQSYATCFDTCDGCSSELPGCFTSSSVDLKAVEVCYDEPAPAQTVIFNYVFFSQSSFSCVYQYCPGQDTFLCNFLPTGLVSVLRPSDGVCRPYMREFLSFPGCTTTGIYMTFTKPTSCP